MSVRTLDPFLHDFTRIKEKHATFQAVESWYSCFSSSMLERRPKPFRPSDQPAKNCKFNHETYRNDPDCVYKITQYPCKKLEPGELCCNCVATGKSFGSDLRSSFGWFSGSLLPCLVWFNSWRTAVNLAVLCISRPCIVVLLTTMLQDGLSYVAKWVPGSTSLPLSRLPPRVPAWCPVPHETRSWHKIDNRSDAPKGQRRCAATLAPRNSYLNATLVGSQSAGQ